MRRGWRGSWIFPASWCRAIPASCAPWALLLTDLRADFASTKLLTLGAESLPAVAAAFEALLKRAGAWFADEHIPPEARRTTRTVDMRYAGQNYELPIAVPDGPVGPATLDALAAGFDAAHRRMYGFVAEGEPVQLVTMRVEAAGVVPKAAFQPRAEGPADASDAIMGRREVWLAEVGGFVDCPVYDRERLAPGHRLTGPAIVEQMDATTVVLPGMTGRVEPYGNLILEAA